MRVQSHHLSKALVLSLIFTTFSLSSRAQNTNELSDVLEAIGKDLAQLQQEVQTSYHPHWFMEGSSSWAPQSMQVKATAAKVNVYRGAALNSGVITASQNGKTWDVIDQAGEWYAVDLDDPAQGMKSGWVKATDVVPQPKFAQGTLPAADGIYQKLMESVRGIKEKYNNNPYVAVTGFSVDISVPPSVSIDFAFK